MLTASFSPMFWSAAFGKLSNFSTFSNPAQFTSILTTQGSLFSQQTASVTTTKKQVIKKNKNTPADCSKDCNQKFESTKCCEDETKHCLKRKFHSLETLKNFAKVADYFQLMDLFVVLFFWIFLASKFNLKTTIISERTFDIDVVALEKIYKNFQKQYHPDKFARLSEQEKEISALQSTLINRAYETLKDPRERARYLLDLRGEKVEDTDLPEGFLTHIFMEMEAVENSGEGEKKEEILQKKRKRIAKEINEVVDGLHEAFRENDIKEVKQLVAILNYFIRLNEGLENGINEF